MTTTIQPSAGAGALFTQQGVGTTPGYAALDDRRSNSGSLQEGVFGTSTSVTAGGVGGVTQADFMVTQRGSGANMSVDVNMPAGGFAFVQGDTINGQGLYTVPVHASNINELIATADPTNPRIDSVILEIQDNVLDASGGNLARTRVLTGTPTGGATLANRSGAVALPGSALLLADVLVGAAVGSIANSVIRDRRKWGRGFYNRVSDNSSGNISQGITASIVAFGPTFRLESAGVPLRISIQANWSMLTSGVLDLFPLIDGAVIDGMTTGGGGPYSKVTPANDTDYAALAWITNPAAGSHTVQWGLTTTQSVTIGRSTGIPLEVYAEELVRQTAPNNAVTTG